MTIAMKTTQSGLDTNESPWAAGAEFGPNATKSRPGETKAVRRCRMLLVDNSTTLLRAIESMLASVGWIHVVGCAHSGVQALEWIDLLEPHLILLDLAMPGMDGLEVTRTLMGRPGRPRIIMMTAHIDDDYRRAATDAGVDGFILKADLSDGLVSLITAVEDGRGEEN